MDFKKEIANEINKVLTIDVEVDDYIETPTDDDKGDFALPCFFMSKDLKKSPSDIALQLSKKVIKPDFLDRVEPLGGYINFYLKKPLFSTMVLEKVLNTKGYGSSNIGKGKTLIIDYSSPNIAKPFHVGHLRSTVIGASLYRIYKYIGYNVVSINHLGDWGTQFGKLIVAYKSFGDRELIERDGIKELMRIYVMFHEKAKIDKSLEEQARSWFLKMQEGDEEALSLWKWFNDISLVEFNRIYDRLGISFDYYTGESFYNDKMDAVIVDLKEKGLMINSDGAMVVDLSEYSMPPCLILRSDGGTLYPTRDIAAAIYRKTEFDFDKCIYVTAVDQKLHFEQWFKVIEKMDYTWAKNLEHVSFGLVNLETGKLSTREGNVVLMDDLLNESAKKAFAIINEKNPELEDKEDIAEAVGIGAMIFNDLFNSRAKNVTFSWDNMLSFDGETGPYLQYTHARLCSILVKAGLELDNYSFYKDIVYKGAQSVTDIIVIKHLYLFKDKVLEAANKYEPFIISRYLIGLAKVFNKFYEDNKILVHDPHRRAFRLSIVYAVKHVLAEGLYLLGLKSLAKM